MTDRNSDRAFPSTSERTISPQRRCRFIAVTVTFLILLACAVVNYLYQFLEHSPSVFSNEGAAIGSRVDPRLHDGEEYPYAGGPGFVWDKDTLIRPREDFSMVRENQPFGGGLVKRFTIHQVEYGIIRQNPIGFDPGRPRILLIGDSHTHAVTPHDPNVAHQLEVRLREPPGSAQTTVVNASCSFYGLYQYVCRVRALWELLQPDLVILMIFTGNDLLDMEDEYRPHLDDDLIEQPFNLTPPPEKTTDRRLLYLKTAPTQFDNLFWQGMNQAIYFCQYPKRYEILLAKARRSIELMQAYCREHNAGLVIALVPAFDDFVDYELPFELDQSLEAVTDLKSNRKVRRDLGKFLTGAGIPFVDGYNVLRPLTPEQAYLSDFHISETSHERIAQALEPLVQEELLKIQSTRKDTESTD